jgi:hypothetical protein
MQQFHADSNYVASTIVGTSLPGGVTQFAYFDFNGLSPFVFHEQLNNHAPRK